MRNFWRRKPKPEVPRTDDARDQGEAIAKGKGKNSHAGPLAENSQRSFNADENAPQGLSTTARVSEGFSKEVKNSNGPDDFDTSYAPVDNVPQNSASRSGFDQIAGADGPGDAVDDGHIQDSSSHDVESDVQSRHSHIDGAAASERFKCDVCFKDSPELCCLTCDPEGVPYHKECWITERLHKPRPDQSYQTHRSIPITYFGRLRYINEPNKQTSIEESRFQEDDQNCFIKFDVQSRQLQFGHRAFPLIHHELDEDLTQYPSLVSFVGRTMNGKSFLIRALQYTEETQRLPTPIPAPGAQSHNHDSTSSDIHLYSDSTTARNQSPILFLDCEGFDGSDVPRSLRARLTGSAAAAERRAFVEAVYPRLVYAFSTCIVFVTSGPLAGADDIKRRLISYASQGASGSINQGFKPSLFLVFNRFEDGNKPDFDWSIDSSSKAFLADENRAVLENFYSNIRVVYIPSMHSEAAIALQQIDAFEKILRTEHKVAFLRRQEFRLDFTPPQLVHVLRRALEIFSEGSNSVFDWSVEADHLQFDYNDPTMPLRDLWTQYVRYHANSESYQRRYDLVRKDFENHLTLCLRLELSRHPCPGLRYTHVPPNWAKKIEQLCVDYAPCGAASPSGLKCEKVQLRHGDHHQTLNPQHAPDIRWPGVYETYAKSQTFQESFKVASQKGEVSLDELRTLPLDIQSVVSCLGCLQGPPSTVLACGHAFCFDCIRELTHNEPLPHQCTVIQCPIHQAPQAFSPRLLPIQSGYRILSLDGGGVKGLVQLIMLRHIKKKCFEIPLIHLFDLVVGTNVGGQIALALTSQAQSGPLSVGATTDTFREFMKDAFDRKLLGYGVVSSATDKTKYKTTKLESQLRQLFREEYLFSAATSSRSGLPNIAVTTVVRESLEAHLVTNYNRKPSAGALPVLLGPNPVDCMPLWAAARCTAAAVSYFKPLEWKGQILIDGGFKLSCPAACAYSEAKSIWPDKRCDILLSLGTGRAPEHHDQRPPGNSKHFLPFGSGNATNRPLAQKRRTTHAREIADAEEMWTKFKAALSPKDGMFRLNPTYNGNGFEVDDYQKLNEIERQAEEWIATQSSSLSHICNQLIAALFFFRLKTTEDGVQAGEIVCRLPTDLEVRRKLIERMLEENSQLFVIEIDGCSDKISPFIDAQVLRRLGITDELQFRVGPLPAIDGIKIHVRMKSLDMDQSGAMQWLPISGSPYVI